GSSRRAVCSYGFFFSSRRRHTRWPRDWSSDVCSSDLKQMGLGQMTDERVKSKDVQDLMHRLRLVPPPGGSLERRPREKLTVYLRSEERRVGKECRCLWSR